MESALLSFSRHLAVVWLLLPTDHLGQTALSFNQIPFSWVQCSCYCMHGKHFFGINLNRCLGVYHSNGVFECSFYYAACTYIDMSHVCVHCRRCYICLELLTPTDSESLPGGQRRENGKGTWEPSHNETARERDEQSDGKKREKKEEEKSDRIWKAVRGVDETVWPAALSALVHHVGWGRLVSSATRACQNSCVSSGTLEIHSIAH